MITVLQRPNDIQLSGNPIDIELLASRADGSPAISAGGSRARLNGKPNAGLPVNTFVSLNWANAEGVESAVNFHTDGPFAGAYEIPEYNGGNLGAYWRELAAVIGGNLEVSPFFFVTSSQNRDGTYGISVVARSNDPAWSIGWGPNASTKFTTINDQPGNENLGYRIRVQLFLERAGRYAMVGEFGSAPNAESRLAFDVSGLISDAIREQLPIPGLPFYYTNRPVLAETVYPYYLNIAEYTTAGGYGSRTVLQGFSALAGAVGGRFLSGNFVADLSLENTWLCARPDERTIGEKEPVFLSWMRPRGAAGFTSLQVEEFDEENNSTTKTIFPATLAQYQAVTFPVGVRPLEIAADTVYYRVRATNSGAAGPWRTFTIDRTEYESVRYIAYLNSFFLPEIFRCIGSAAHSMSASYQTYASVRPINGGAAIPGKGNWRTDVEEEYVFHSGYKPQEEVANVARELIESPRVYEFLPSGNVPLLPVGKSFQLDRSGQNLHSLTLAFELAELEKGATFGSTSPGGGTTGGDNEPPVIGDGDGDNSTNPNAWLGPDGQPWLGPDGQPWTA